MPRVLIVLISVASVLLLAYCGREIGRAPHITVELGMPVEELRAQSDYRFEDPLEYESPFRGPQRFAASGLVDVTYLQDGEALTLTEIGPRRFAQFFTFKEDVLTSIELFPHRRKLTLEQALALAVDLGAGSMFRGLCVRKNIQSGAWETTRCCPRSLGLISWLLCSATVISSFPKWWSIAPRWMISASSSRF